jgi:hypothetical protein
MTTIRLSDVRTDFSKKYPPPETSEIIHDAEFLLNAVTTKKQKTINAMIAIPLSTFFNIFRSSLA